MILQRVIFQTSNYFSKKQKQNVNEGQVTALLTITKDKLTYGQKSSFYFFSLIVDIKVRYHMSRALSRQGDSCFHGFKAFFFFFCDLPLHPPTKSSKQTSVWLQKTNSKLKIIC